MPTHNGCQKKIKYHGITLTKDVKDTYDENYETLKNNIEDTNTLKKLTFSWIAKINVMRMYQ